MHAKYVSFFSILFIGILNIKAQQDISISLESILEKVAENNYTIKISDQDHKIAKAEFKQVNAIFFPSISITHSGISTNNPLMAFGSKLNQEILTQSDFDPSLLNNPENISNFITKIAVQQPIFNADGFYHRKASRAKMNAMELQSLRVKDAIKLEVTKTYMQLQLAYKTVDVLEKMKESTNENFRVAQNKFNQGYLQKSDILLVEVHATSIENKLINAKSILKNTSDYVHLLMGQENKGSIKPVEELKPKFNLEVNNYQLSSSRSDIAALEMNSIAHTNMLKASKMSYLPKLNAFANYELYDDKLFNTSASGYLFGAQLSWDLFEGFKRIGIVQKSKAASDKAILNLDSYKIQSQLELNKAARQLTDAENKLHLSNLAVQQSNEVVRIKTNRFNQGLEKTADLLNAESQYLHKQLDYFQTVFNFNYTKAYLEFLSN